MHLELASVLKGKNISWFDLWVNNSTFFITDADCFMVLLLCFALALPRSVFFILRAYFDEVLVGLFCLFCLARLDVLALLPYLLFILKCLIRSPFM